MGNESNRYKDLLILLGASVAVYFLFPLIITFDTAHYLEHVNILKGLVPLETWDVARGPLYPIILFLGEKILGDSSQAMLILLYICFWILILYTYKIGELFFVDRKVLKIGIIIGLIFNPIILGYYHTLLTEPIAMSICILALYYLLLYVRKPSEYLCNNKKFLTLWCIIGIIICALWNIKQPYISVVILIIICISFFNKSYFTFKKISVMIVCTLFPLLIITNMWNGFIDKCIVTYNTERTNNALISKQITSGLIYFELNKVTDKVNYEEIVNELKEDEILYKITSSNREDSKLVILDEELSIKSSVKYFFSCMKYDPMLVFKGYIDSYLGIINFYEAEHTNDLSSVIINKEVSLLRAKENDIIAYRISRIDDKTSNIFYMNENLYKNVKKYKYEGEVSQISVNIIRLLMPIHNIIFTMLGLISPFILIYKVFKYRRNNALLDKLIIMLTMVHTMYISIYSSLAGVIDRYVFISYVLLYIGIMILILDKISKKINHRKNGTAYIQE
jgi:hypothetical protein